MAGPCRNSWFTVSRQTSVPEPGDLILFGTVLGSLGLAKCRKKRQA